MRVQFSIYRRLDAPGETAFASMEQIPRVGDSVTLADENELIVHNVVWYPWETETLAPRVYIVLRG